MTSLSVSLQGFISSGYLFYGILIITWHRNSIVRFYVIFQFWINILKPEIHFFCHGNISAWSSLLSWKWPRSPIGTLSPFRLLWIRPQSPRRYRLALYRFIIPQLLCYHFHLHNLFPLLRRLLPQLFFHLIITFLKFRQQLAFLLLPLQSRRHLITLSRFLKLFKVFLLTPQIIIPNCQQRLFFLCFLRILLISF